MVEAIAQIVIPVATEFQVPDFLRFSEPHYLAKRLFPHWIGNAYLLQQFVVIDLPSRNPDNRLIVVHIEMPSDCALRPRVLAEKILEQGDYLSGTFQCRTHLYSQRMDITRFVGG